MSLEAEHTPLQPQPEPPELNSPLPQPTHLEPERKPKAGDFASGERTTEEDKTGTDFAAGERTSEEDETGTDFAAGERSLPKDPQAHPDFARGQDAV